MTELEPVADAMLKKACDAFAETYVTYPDGCASTPITDWFDLDAQDAVDFGVLKSPKWSYHSDIRSDEYRDYVAAVIRNPMQAALSSAQSLLAERDKRIAELEAAVKREAELATSMAEDRNDAEALLKEAGPVIDKLRTALLPLCNAVFNDNGDISVNYPVSFTSEHCISAYFAERAARSLMSKIGERNGE